MEVIVQPEEAFVILWNAIIAIGAGYLSAPITTVLTNGGKLIPGINKLSAVTLRAVIAVVLTVLTWVFTALGLQIQFEGIVEILGVVGTMLFQTFFNIQGSGKVHQQGRALGDKQIFGFSRTPNAL